MQTVKGNIDITLMDSSPHFIIGKTTSEFLKIEVLNYERPDNSNYWDANWVNARIQIKTRSFSGSYLAQLRTGDFIEFKTGLANLYEDLNGLIQFNSMEEWITIVIRGDGIGNFDVECMACDCPGTGNRLEFQMQMDQTEIPKLISQIENILSKFPVRGVPDNQKK